MRDILTILAGLLILALAAVLAIPPFVDWPAHRALVDRGIARALGQPVRTAGSLDLRLLPSPRIRIQRLTVGSGDPAEASLDAMYVRAEVALTPLLAGEVRFLDTRIGRAEAKLPTGAGGDWRVPRRLVAGVEQKRAWAFEDLAVQQLLLTTSDPATGRTDQAYAENVRVQAPSFAGPWRLEGSSGAVPFELSLGEFTADLASSLKVRGGGAGGPRLDVDGRLELVPDGDDTLVPRFAGTGRLVSRPSVPPQGGGTRLPVQAQASVKASGRTLELGDIALDVGEGAGSLRLAGSGSVRVDEPLLALALSGRRVDLPALRPGAGTALLAGWREVSGGMPVNLALRVDSLAVGGDDDLSDLDLAARIESDRVRLARLEVAGPGRSALRLSGELVPEADGVGGSLRAEMRSQDSERLGRFLRGLAGADPGGLLGLLDGRPLQVSTDLTLAAPVLSIRNLRASLGEAALTGTLRHSAAEGGRRARLDGQVALSGLDLAALPDGGAALRATRDLDVGLTLDARDIRYGVAGGGRISGRFATDGAEIVVDDLEVSGLAGAEASLSGRISPEGAGRIAGRLRAREAAPLIDLFGRAWLGGVVRLVPDVVRDRSLDLAVTAERVQGAPALRTRLEGQVAGGPFLADAVAAGGLLGEVVLRAGSGPAAPWFAGGRAAAAEGLAGSVDLSGRRGEDGRLWVRGRAELAGLRVSVVDPVRLGPEDDRVEAGRVDLVAADASPLLASALGIAVPPPVEARLSATAARRGERLGLSLAGRVAGEEVEIELAGRSPAEIEGQARLSRLSLPWLASALALQAPPAAGAAAPAAIWSGSRFGPLPEPRLAGTVAIEAAILEGPGRLRGRDARLTVATRPDGFAVSGLDVGFGGGRVRGGFTLGRQGGLAALIGEGSADGVAVAELFGPPFAAGRLSGSLRFGGSGESAAGLVGNLGGAGEITLDGLQVLSADPGALERVASRVLRTDDPLASARWQALLAEELGRSPLAPGPARANASLVGGAIRITPLLLASPAGSWQGSAAIDLRDLRMDLRGTLQATALPRHWVGGPPQAGLGWSGPLARPARQIDAAPLVNGLAAVVLSRELDRVETFELDAAERQRRTSRTEMERQRRLAAEEAARQARLREEADERARQEQARLEAERQRRDAERQRELDRQRQESERRAPPPIEIRPPAQTGQQGGG